MIHDDRDDAFQVDICAERLKALGDPQRLRIVDLLRYGELSVGDIAEFLETQVANVSHHLQILKRARLVTPRRDGRFIDYQLHENLARSTGRSRQVLDLGCCTIQIPSPRRALGDRARNRAVPKGNHKAATAWTGSTFRPLTVDASERTTKLAGSEITSADFQLSNSRWSVSRAESRPDAG